MDWDDIQREFDRVNEMSCKPVGLQKYKVGHTLAVMAVFPSSTGSTDFLLPEPPGAAAPFCEHGDRPLPVQARKCPKITGGKDNAEILSHAAVQQSKKQRKPP